MHTRSSEFGTEGRIDFRVFASGYFMFPYFIYFIYVLCLCVWLFFVFFFEFFVWFFFLSYI